MSKEEDILLINQFINGNISAFDKLVLKYKNIVFNLCFKILYNYEDAEDCSQEVFIKVYNAIKNFKFNSSFKTWLYTIALNTCRNRLKSIEYRFRKNKISLNSNLNPAGDPLEIHIPDNSYSPNDSLNNKELGNSILKTINDLPDKYKVLVILKDIEEKSYEEIVTMTGLKIGTVKSILFRAREKLRVKLKGII